MVRTYSRASAAAGDVRSRDVQVPQADSGSAGSSCAASNQHMTAAFLVVALRLAGQQPATAPATPAEVNPVNIDDLPVSLNRIQRALAAPPAIKLSEEHPVFRLEVFGRKQSIEDILGEKF